MATAGDYGPPRSGWLADRLFPLANKIVLKGRVANCSVKKQPDDDIEFSLAPTEESKKKLARYLDITAPPHVHPEAVGVEIMPAFPHSGSESPFSFWGANCSPSCAQYVPAGVTKARDIASASDITSILQPGKNCVEVTGSLVIDMNGTVPGSTNPGGGQLEIHPVDRVRVLAEAECKGILDEGLPVSARRE
jgi:hypothetical protein